ncbi:MAG: Lrp/AsnC family transcriptional regulator [Desulfarculaceae bacterium]|nr:Lrp/AsnC family transcriptional regulator [Desulfarculaceae bacterium]
MLNQLRRESRIPLTAIAKVTGIPVSTVFKKVKRFHEQGLVRHACLLDFDRLGFPLRVGVFLRASKKSEVKKALASLPCLNNFYQVSGAYDFYADMVFKDWHSYESLLDKLKSMEAVQSIRAHFIQPVRQEVFEV